MSSSSPLGVARKRRARRRSRARNVPPKRSTVRPRMLAFRYALVVTAVWLIAGGIYIAFRDDAGLSRLIDEQAALQLTYEDRIAELRGQLDRIMSQKLLDQEQVEQRVNSLLQRQARMSLSLDNVEQKQVATLTDLGERIDMRAHQMQTVLADLGIKVGRAPEGATGGPFVPVKPPQSEAGAFESQLHRINAGRAQMDLYNRALAAVPVRTPVTGETDLTSSFGMRLHPILKRLAIHTGIDLRGDLGEPVRATATGKVTIAGRQRGYGNVVEISHGNGLATRFGHLSEINVKVGQVVRIGEIVGKIGSTGLSTGPHLHYETRLNGKPVDPQKFLRAGLRLDDASAATNSQPQVK